MNTRIASLWLNCLHLSILNLRLQFRAYHIFINTSFYLFTLNFIIYLLFLRADFKVKTALFWISLFLIILYFIQQSLTKNQNNIAFYYFIVSPFTFLLANIIQNSIINFVFAILNSFIFYILFEYHISNLGLFFSLLVGATFGFSILFSFLAAISRYSEQSTGFLSVLSLPLIIPQLGLILKIASQLEQSNPAIPWSYLLALLSLDILTLSLVLILFRYLWKL